MSDEFIEVRQRMRKAIKQIVANLDEPVTPAKLIVTIRKIKSLQAIHNDAKEFDQAIAILTMQQEIATDGNGHYVIPGKTYKRSKFRTLDDAWEC